MQALRGRCGRAPSFLSATAGSRPKVPLAGWLSGRAGVGRARAGGGTDARLGLCGKRERGRATPPSASATAPPPPIPSLEPRSGPRTQRRVSLAPALWPTALPGSGSDGVVVVSRGPLAERLLARGLPAERQGARQGGLGSGRGSGFPRERAPWRRGRGRGPGAGGWAGRARRASAPSPAEHPSRDGLVQGRPVCAGQQEGWMARVPGGRQAGCGPAKNARRTRVEGTRQPLGGQGGGSAASLWLGSAGGPAGRARRTGCRPGGRAGGGGRGSKAARASRPFPGQKSERRRREEGLPPAAGLRASARPGAGRGGAVGVGVGGWASVGQGEAGRQEKQQLQLQPAGEERCAEKD